MGKTNLFHCNVVLIRRTSTLRVAEAYEHLQLIYEAAEVTKEALFVWIITAHSDDQIFHAIMDLFHRHAVRMRTYPLFTA